MRWSVARAQAPEDDSPAVVEARQRFDLAQQAFERGDYASSLTEFERVFALLDGRPRREYVLYNIARANEELGRTQAAADAYERYLSSTGEDAPNRAEAQRHLQELRLRLHLADEDRGTPESAGLSPSPVGIAIASVGVAAVIVGAIVGGVALAQDGDARADCDEARCTQEAYDALVGAGTLANVADGLLWGGLGVAAVGAVLTFVLGQSGDTQASAACDAHGCGAVIRGRF